MKKLLFLLVLLFLAGCIKRESLDTDKPYTLDPIDGDVIIIYEDGYEAETFATLTEEAELRGLLCREDDILAVDMLGNKILRFGYDGTLLETIGVTGNGEGEFLNPLALAEHDGKLYLLDAGNFRIVVLNQEFLMEKEISLQELGIHDFSSGDSSLAVLNENAIFITSSYENKAFLLKNQNELLTLEENFYGVCTVGGGKAYVAQSVLVNGSIAETGKVFYAEYNEKEGLIKNQLPYFNSPRDLIVFGEDMYVLNGYYGAIERCALNGDYKKTIYKFAKTLDDRTYLTHFAIDSERNFYVYDNYNHVIKKVYKAK